MIKLIIKQEIKDMMKRADNSDVDFLDLFGNYRRRIVYGSKVVSDDEFDEICEQVLREVEEKI
jgi:hypothetical protein